MKLAMIDATFPELKGGFSQRTGRGEGSTAKAAISRAVADLLRSGKRKHFTTIRCTITVITKADNVRFDDGSNPIPSEKRGNGR